MPAYEANSEPVKSSEPLRLRGYTAVTVGAVLAAVVLLSAGLEPRFIAGAVAVMLLSEVGGLEWARRHVSPYEPEPDGYDADGYESAP